MIRKPAVAGYFYPADPAALRALVEQCLRWRPEPAPSRPESAVATAAVAVVAPHAGYEYSGRVAGSVFGSTSLPRKLVILCPNHTGEGRPIAVMSRGVWRTPLGDAVIDEPLAELILQTCGDLAEEDHEAHRREHALEVQLPFLQVRMPEFAFVPICVGVSGLDPLTRLGRGLARVLQKNPEPVGIVISSDMSHYVTSEEARRKDMMAVERMMALDPEGLHRVVHEMEISMCGYAPAVAALTAVRGVGARAGRLVAYANSGEASGDDNRVVGYAGLAIS